MPPTLDATRVLDGWRSFPLRWRRGVVTYRIVSECEPRADPERRGVARARARLRSAKLLDMKLRFLADGRIRDRSPGGVRLSVADAVSLPAYLHFYDDESTTLRRARVAWRRSGEIGLHLLSGRPVRDLTRAERAALAGRYYAAR